MLQFRQIIGKFIDNDLFETLKHTTNYFNADIATKALGLISVPVFTRLLTTEDYGMFNIYFSYIGIFTLALTFNLYSAVSRYYYERENDLNGFMGTTLIISAIGLSIGIVIFGVFSNQISKLTGLPESLIFLSIPHVLFIVIFSLFNQIMQCRKESKRLAITSIIQCYAGFALSILLIFLIPKDRYLGYIYGIFIAAGLVSVYCLYKLREYTKLVFIKKHLIYILKFTVPLIPYVFGALLLAQFDRIIIGNINGKHQAGLYSLAYNIAMLVSTFSRATQNAIYPDFFKLILEKQYQRIYLLDQKVYSIILIFSLSLIYYVEEVTRLLASEKFHEAISIIPIVILAYVIMAISDVYCRYLNYEKRTGYMAIALVIPGIINVMLNFYYLPHYGYAAGAYTTLVAYIIMMLLAYYFATSSIRSIPVMPLKMFAKETVLFLVFVGLYYIINYSNSYGILIICLKFLMVLGFITMIFWDKLKVFATGKTS